MTTPALQRKVRQLDNDVQSIYELLAGISSTQVRHGNRLGELDQRFDGLETRFDGLETRFDALDGKVDGVDGKVDGLGSKLDSVLDLLRGRNGG